MAQLYSISVAHVPVKSCMLVSLVPKLHDSKQNNIPRNWLARGRQMFSAGGNSCMWYKCAHTPILTPSIGEKSSKKRERTADPETVFFLLRLRGHAG